MRNLILASTSPYRRALLARLGLSFTVEAPEVDESPLPEEAADQLAPRLARAKADVVAARHANAIIIGCDQVATVGAAVLGKPGSPEAACAQLRRMSGQVVEFRTALCVIDSAAARSTVDVSLTRLHLRRLSDAAIANYVARDRPFDCAGAFRSEALGLALVEHMQCDDPTGLVGLPLILLVTRLLELGVEVPPRSG